MTVIQFSIKAADPSVQVEHISWKFIASGMSSIITNDHHHMWWWSIDNNTRL